MMSVVRIYIDYPTIRIYALRGGLSFGSMVTTAFASLGLASSLFFRLTTGTNAI